MIHPPIFPLRHLYIDFNSYFASVEQQLRPELRGKPIAVVPVDTQSTCAIAASYEAKAFGVRTGTPIWEARRLCPDLICVLARHEAYVDFHHRAIAEIERHLPVDAVCSIDEMAARLMRNEAPREQAEAIARSIKAGIKANLGEWMRCSIGIAPNRYLAKVAGEMKKPDGLTVLMPEDIVPRLTTELELTDLPGIGRNMARRLHMQGVHTIADVFALDRRQMRHVWGSIWGERMWYLLRGHDLPEPETERRTVGHSHVLGPELRPPDQAIVVARRLTLKAVSRMRRMDYLARRFYLSARFENGRGCGMELRCRPSQDSMTFLVMMQQAWDACIGVHHPGSILIKKLSVTLYGLSPAGHGQLDLFDDGPVDLQLPGSRIERNLRISLALDRLNQRFGRDTVLIGMMPSAGRGFSGTKIAFTRIPDLQEFHE